MNRHAMKAHRRKAKLARMVRLAANIAGLNEIKTLHIRFYVPKLPRDEMADQFVSRSAFAVEQLCAAVIKDRLVEEHIRPADDGGLNVSFILRIATRKPFPVRYEGAP